MGGEVVEGMLRARLAPIVAAVLATAATTLAVGSCIPSPDEPYPIRWLRTASAHPIRTTLALALLGTGVVGLRNGREAVDPAATPRDREEEELG